MPHAQRIQAALAFATALFLPTVAWASSWTFKIVPLLIRPLDFLNFGACALALFILHRRRREAASRWPELAAVVATVALSLGAGLVFAPDTGIAQGYDSYGVWGPGLAAYMVALLVIARRQPRVTHGVVLLLVVGGIGLACSIGKAAGLYEGRVGFINAPREIVSEVDF